MILITLGTWRLQRTDDTELKKIKKKTVARGGAVDADR